MSTHAPSPAATGDGKQFRRHCGEQIEQALPFGAATEESHLRVDRVRELAERVARRAFRSWWTERLTVKEAAAWSGFSADWIYEQIREGRLPDPRPPGSQGSVWVRRCDLPRRPALDPGRPTEPGLPVSEETGEARESGELATEGTRRYR